MKRALIITWSVLGALLAATVVWLVVVVVVFERKQNTSCPIENTPTPLNTLAHTPVPTDTCVLDLLKNTWCSAKEMEQVDKQFMVLQTQGGAHNPNILVRQLATLDYVMKTCTENDSLTYTLDCAAGYVLIRLSEHGKPQNKAWALPFSSLEDENSWIVGNSLEKNSRVLIRLCPTGSANVSFWFMDVDNGYCQEVF